MTAKAQAAIKYGGGQWTDWQQPCSPLFLTLTFNAMYHELPEYIGAVWPTTLVVYSGGQGWWMNRWQDLRALGQKMIDFLMNEEYYASFVQGFEHWEQRVLDHVKTIGTSQDLSKTTDSELTRAFESLARTYYRWFAYAWFCEPVGFCIQNAPDGPNLLEPAWERLSAEGRLNVPIADASRAIFALDEESFSLEILEHLHRCAQALDNCLDDGIRVGELAAVYGQSEQGARGTPSGTVGTLIRLLDEHAGRYSWKTNNYQSSRTLTGRDVLDELLALRSDSTGDPSGRLATILRAQLDAAREQIEEARQAKGELLALLPPYYRKLASLASWVGGSLQDRRKRTVMTANGAFDLLLREAARRTDTPLEDCHQLIPQEFGAFVTEPERFRPQLEQRHECCLVYQGDFHLTAAEVSERIHGHASSEIGFSLTRMQEPGIHQGDNAHEVIAELNAELNFLFDQTLLAEANELTGEVAYGGVPEVRGIVRVILDPARETLESGEILVAPATTPDYMAAIRRSAAIVTDWGTQTSHAAIVSRELRKPCVIGTKVASVVLRTGDRIRIDLARGVIHREAES